MQVDSIFKISVKSGSLALHDENSNGQHIPYQQFK